MMAFSFHLPLANQIQYFIMHTIIKCFWKFPAQYNPEIWLPGISCTQSRTCLYYESNEMFISTESTCRGFCLFVFCFPDTCGQLQEAPSILLGIWDSKHFKETGSLCWLVFSYVSVLLNRPFFTRLLLFPGLFICLFVCLFLLLQVELLTKVNNQSWACCKGCHVSLSLLSETK